MTADTTAAMTATLATWARTKLDAGLCVCKQALTWLQRLIARITRGFFDLTHNSFALVGLAVMFSVITLVVHPEIRQLGELKLMGWLQDRHAAPAADASGMDTVADAEPEAVDRATATNPSTLPKPQAALAYWLSKKYRVAPEPVSALVSEAFDIGGRTQLDPTLILAVMAVESGFNPFAQSAVGAQGLMQVMTRVHSDKYESFGGKLAAFDPVTNLRVGAKVLQECIARAGSIEAGLRYYVGAANNEVDGGYTAKVMAEHSRLKLVTAGRNVPGLSAPNAGAPAHSVPVASPPVAPSESVVEKVAALFSS